MLDELTRTLSLNLGLTDRLLIEYGLSRTDLFVILMIAVLFILGSISRNISEIQKRQEDSLFVKKSLEMLKSSSDKERKINEYSNEYIYHARKLDKAYSYTHVVTIFGGLFIVFNLPESWFAWMPFWLGFILTIITFGFLAYLGEEIEDKFDLASKNYHTKKTQGYLKKIRDLQGISKPKKN